MGDVYQWTNSDTNLDAPYNWYDETQTNPGAIPGPNDVAIINYGQSLTGTLNVSTLLLEQASGGPSLSITGTSTSVTAQVVAVAGTMALTGAADLTVDTLELLGGGTTLTLQSGANLTGNSADDASITIGTTSGISVLSVSGINTNESYSSVGGSLLIGDSSGSSATVTVINGGSLSGIFDDVEIGATGGATATMNVSGPGSVIELNSFAEIGGYGTGVLTVQKGAYASLGGGQYVIVGGSEDGNPSSGTVNVTGAGSELSLTGTVILGTPGYSSGEMTDSAGGEIAAAGDTYIESGSLTVTGAGSVFNGQLLQIDTTNAGLTVSNGGAVNLVTLHLDTGKISLDDTEMTVRRSAYVSSGATLTGSGTFAAGIIYNSGLLNAAAGGTMRFIGQVNQTGAAHIQAGATLEFDSTVLNTQTVTFSAAMGTLALGDAADFAARIAGFGQGETIDLLGDQVGSYTENGRTLILKYGNTVVAKLAFNAAHSQADFRFASDGHGGTDITYVKTAAAAVMQSWHAMG